MAEEMLFSAHYVTVTLCIEDSGKVEPATLRHRCMCTRFDKLHQGWGWGIVTFGFFQRKIGFLSSLMYI
jgi:hypothetical protein